MANLSPRYTKGPEVVEQAVRVLELVSSKSKEFNLSLKSVSLYAEEQRKGWGLIRAALWPPPSSPLEELESMLTASLFRTRLETLARRLMRSFSVSTHTLLRDR